ncbi:Beta-galactosidase [Levilactobacillus brevis]|nr:Beta-galactosidase [Levilactobacillus brevis]
MSEGQAMKDILYGTAYYYEYLPVDRLDKDIEMMKAANINVVRIGESTWSTYEPQVRCF